MNIITLTIILFVALILGLVSGMSIAFALGGIAMVFTIFLWGPEGLFMSVTATYSNMSAFVLIAIPMFVFMGFVLEKSGVADALYATMSLWAGRVNGGLAIGTVLICTLIAAMVGIIGAGIITAAIFALPPMLKHGYDKHLAYGAIMAGGCLGALIPPSVQMVVYASIAEQSVGRMLLGGFFPGLLLSSFYMLYIGIRTALNPSLGPGLPPEERVSWPRKLAATKSLLLPIAVVVSVLGSIFLGIATPTEAGAIGCVGVIVCAAVHRRLSWWLLKEAAYDTAKIFGMVFWILIGAACFNQFYLAMGAAGLVKGLLVGIEVNPWIILVAMQVILILLGMIMEDLAIMVIAAPIFTPIVISLGFDPLWFGVIFIINMQIAMLTPPFGFANFYMKGLLPEENMAEFYRSTYPFVGLQIIGMGMCMAFPSIILWLPSLMIK